MAFILVNEPASAGLTLLENNQRRSCRIHDGVAVAGGKLVGLSQRLEGVSRILADASGVGELERTC